VVQVTAGGTPGTIHGTLIPQVVITNSTTGFNSTVQGSIVTVNTGQNYIINTMNGGMNYGISGLVPQGTMSFQFQGASRWWNTDTVSAQYQFTILHW
jgi:hypothetical protein